MKGRGKRKKRERKTQQNIVRDFERKKQKGRNEEDNSKKKKNFPFQKYAGSGKDYFEQNTRVHFFRYAMCTHKYLDNTKTHEKIQKLERSERVSVCVRQREKNERGSERERGKERLTKNLG